ncbi:Fpg/Nei family DNA glycosylase [Kitasatospora cheerisanensis]|uniref:DNA-(Apurinic or apyrimidinic site) lyase n=1 Tax=Kitasatospora cheerisanensis KCTC 2395 TaxID=1348663 RepID=A0A066YL82_9ACTN|nr:DNA-formamidopyrimidine glycosylase family protein [Kitasatospora cheerisanensis]KDN81937.1 DNA-(apurinic or apyrimidinic site) lyase [Kitasatospora cheerisanensis KCTC 2395]
MPELPEVQALAERMTAACAGRVLDRVDVLSIQALKTFDPPVQALTGRAVSGVSRHGKFLDLATDGGPHLVVHLARAGWVHRRASFPAKPPSRRGPLALRLVLDDGSGFDLTEQGTTKRLAAHVVTDPQQVPGIARLGVDALAATPEQLAALAAGAKQRLKTFLTDQTVLAGIGNAYSDEILHTAKLSPYALAASLDAERLERLHTAIRQELGGALEQLRAAPAEGLKSEKKANLAVHGRAGESCPVCGDTVRSVNFADSSLQYCPTCQTGGRVLADRRLSRLLK